MGWIRKKIEVPLGELAGNLELYNQHTYKYKCRGHTWQETFKLHDQQGAWNQNCHYT
jgi:hypothetical protein